MLTNREPIVNAGGGKAGSAATGGAKPLAEGSTASSKDAAPMTDAASRLNLSLLVEHDLFSDARPTP